MLDLKIKGKKAIVCAASKGLGRACAISLGHARRRPGDHRAHPRDARSDRRRDPQETGAKFPRGRRRHRRRASTQAALAACPNRTSWSTITAVRRRTISATGRPRTGTTRGQQRHADPDRLIKAVRRRHGRRRVRADRQHHLGARSKSPSPDRVCPARPASPPGLGVQAPRHSRSPWTTWHQRLLPERVPDTDRRRRVRRSDAAVRGISSVEGVLRASAASVTPAGRLGDPAEVGDACAFLCGASSGLHRRPEPAVGRRRLQLDDGMRFPLATADPQALETIRLRIVAAILLTPLLGAGAAAAAEFEPGRRDLHTYRPESRGRSTRRRQRGAVRRPVETGPLHSARALACRCRPPFHPNPAGSPSFQHRHSGGRRIPTPAPTMPIPSRRLRSAPAGWLRQPPRQRYVLQIIATTSTATPGWWRSGLALRRTGLRSGRGVLRHVVQGLAAWARPARDGGSRRHRRGSRRVGLAIGLVTRVDVAPQGLGVAGRQRPGPRRLDPGLARLAADAAPVPCCPRARHRRRSPPRCGGRAA